MSKHTVTIEINGSRFTREVDSRLLLVHFLREDLQMTGTHIGCDTTHCGACTVLMDGRSIKACTVYAVQANGKSLTTLRVWKMEGTSSASRGFPRGARPPMRFLYSRYDYESR